MCGMNRRQMLGLLPGAVAALSLGACSDKGTGPVEVRWGKESCAYCGMIVDDPRYAAQIRGGEKRKVWKFDDIGDAVLWLAKQSFADDPATEFWVGNSDRGGWIDAKTAWYLEGRKSPMAHNFGAVPDQRPGGVDYAAWTRLILERGAPSDCVVKTEES